VVLDEIAQFGREVRQVLLLSFARRMIGGLQHLNDVSLDFASTLTDWAAFLLLPDAQEHGHGYQAAKFFRWSCDRNRHIEPCWLRHLAPSLHVMLHLGRD
jgi:hypothetical protein